MPPCVDARLLFAPKAFTGLLQLPERWQTPALRVRPDGLLEIDVVFPDGPTEFAPLQLVPHYHRMYDSVGVGVRLDRIDIIVATPDRPRSRASR